jgi:hypothetical protein
MCGHPAPFLRAFSAKCLFKQNTEASQTQPSPAATGLKNWVAIGSVSRRDCVKVAWHEVPGMARKRRPVPEGRYDLLPAGR